MPPVTRAAKAKGFAASLTVVPTPSLKVSPKAKKIAATKASKMKRPSFNSDKEKAARLEATLATGIDHSGLNLGPLSKGGIDLAAPHRAPYSKIRDLIFYETDATKVTASVNELLAASDLYEAGFRSVMKDPNKADYHQLADYYKKTATGVRNALKNYQADPLNTTHQTELIKAVNNLASNAPGLGPHSGVNVSVSDRLHLQTNRPVPVPPLSLKGVPLVPSDELTPRSEAAVKAFSHVPVATTNASKEIVTPSGFFSPKKTLKPGSLSTATTEDITLKKRYTPLRGSLYVKRSAITAPPEVYKPDPMGGWTLVT